MKLGSVRSYITPESKAKIRVSLDLFEEAVDTDKLINLISSVPEGNVTPKMFIYNLIRQAQADKKHIVLPEGTDERILCATEVLLDAQHCRFDNVGQS